MHFEVSQGLFNQVLYGNNCKVNLVLDSGGENDVSVVTAEARVRVDVVVAAGIVAALSMLGQDDDLAGVSIHEVDGRRTAAEEAVVRIADDQPAVAAAVRMPALPREGDPLDLAVGDPHPPCFIVVADIVFVDVNAPDMLPVGIPPLVFLGAHLRSQYQDTGAWSDDAGFTDQPIAFFGSEIPFPFELDDEARVLDGAPVSATAAIRLIERWDIPSRLATNAGYPGCYSGFVTDLARLWMQASADAVLERSMICACGPEPMLKAVATLAREFALPSQLCPEEFMACGVGGCAGCAVEVQTENGTAMRRVCVDGPVFDGSSIYS